MARSTDRGGPHIAATAHAKPLPCICPDHGQTSCLSVIAAVFEAGLPRSALPRPRNNALPNHMVVTCTPPRLKPSKDAHQQQHVYNGKVAS